jgi:hypothetical protein
VIKLSSLAVAACLALSALATPALAQSKAKVTPRQAIEAMQKAGYWGIGGVTRSGNYYYAAAMSPAKKRVRVSVDARTGEIVRVAATRRGAGSVTPETPPSRSFEGARIESDPSLPTTAYQPPGPRRRIGVRSYPYNSYNQPARNWCRYSANAPGC